MESPRCGDAFSEPPALVPCPMARMSPSAQMPPPPSPPPGKKGAAVAVAVPALQGGPGLRGPRGDDVSASESSANIEDTEEDAFQSTIPNLERFYEQMAAKARLPTHPPGNAANANWVLSLARSYRRLSKEKRSRGRLRALLRPGAESDLAETSDFERALCGPSSFPLTPSGMPLQRPKTVITEGPGWSSDSGYEAGYETDADESELSEWEGGQRPARYGHKRKLDALVHLTMRLSVVGKSQQQVEQVEEAEAAALAEAAAQGLPPTKAPRAFGTGPVGLRFSLPHTPPMVRGHPMAMPSSAGLAPARRPSPRPKSFSSGSWSTDCFAVLGGAAGGPEPMALSHTAPPAVAAQSAAFAAHSIGAAFSASASAAPRGTSAVAGGAPLIDGFAANMDVC